MSNAVEKPLVLGTDADLQPRPYKTTFDNIGLLDSAVNKARLGGGFIGKFAVVIIAINAVIGTIACTLSHATPSVAGVIGLGLLSLDFLATTLVFVYAFRYPKTSVMDGAEIIILDQQQGKPRTTEPTGPTDAAPHSFIEF